MLKAPLRVKAIKKTIRNLQRNALAGGLNGILLRQYNYVSNYNNEVVNKANNRKLVVAIVVIFLSVVISVIVGNSVLSVRCLLPNNYLVWEATRPLADCGYCANVTKPIILRNVSRRNFAVRKLFISLSHEISKFLRVVLKFSFIFRTMPIHLNLLLSKIP